MQHTDYYVISPTPPTLWVALRIPSVCLVVGCLFAAMVQSGVLPPVIPYMQEFWFAWIVLSALAIIGIIQAARSLRATVDSIVEGYDRFLRAITTGDSGEGRRELEKHCEYFWGRAHIRCSEVYYEGDYEISFIAKPLSVCSESGRAERALASLVSGVQLGLLFEYRDKQQLLEALQASWIVEPLQTASLIRDLHTVDGRWSELFDVVVKHNTDNSERAVQAIIDLALNGVIAAEVAAYALAKTGDSRAVIERLCDLLNNRPYAPSVIIYMSRCSAGNRALSIEILESRLSSVRNQQGCWDIIEILYQLSWKSDKPVLAALAAGARELQTWGELLESILDRYPLTISNAHLQQLANLPPEERETRKTALHYDSIDPFGSCEKYEVVIDHRQRRRKARELLQQRSRAAGVKQ